MAILQRGAPDTSTQRGAVRAVVSGMKKPASTGWNGSRMSTARTPALK
jgi:hypothetical protein